TAGFSQAATGITGLSFADAYLPGAVTVAYVVTAADAVGNQSQFSRPAWVSTPESWNTAPPTLSWIAPSAAAAAAVSETDMLVEVEAHAAAGIQAFTLSIAPTRSEEHTSELQSPCNLVCRLLLEKKK